MQVSEFKTAPPLALQSWISYNTSSTYFRSTYRQDLCSPPFPLLFTVLAAARSVNLPVALVILFTSFSWRPFHDLDWYYFRRLHWATGNSLRATNSLGLGWHWLFNPLDHSLLVCQDTELHVWWVHLEWNCVHLWKRPMYKAVCGLGDLQRLNTLTCLAIKTMGATIYWASTMCEGPCEAFACFTSNCYKTCREQKVNNIYWTLSQRQGLQSYCFGPQPKASPDSLRHSYLIGLY